MNRSIFLTRAFYALLVLAIILTVSEYVRGDRTVTVETSTGEIQIVFSGLEVWRLENAILCPARTQYNRTADASKDEICDQQFFEPSIQKEHPFSFKWPPQSRVAIKRNSKNGIEIAYLSGDSFKVGESVLPPRSVIIISEEAWIASGSLAFSGEASLGMEIKTGTTGFLHEGQYEFRETSKLWFAESFSTKLGEFIRGDYVEFRSNNNNTAQIVGFISASEAPNAIDVVIFSAAERIGLLVSRYRNQKPVLIEPSWFQTSIRNPAVQGIFSIIALLAAAVGFGANMATIHDSIRSKNRQE